MDAQGTPIARGSESTASPRLRAEEDGCSARQVGLSCIDEKWQDDTTSELMWNPLDLHPDDLLPDDISSPGDEQGWGKPCC